MFFACRIQPKLFNVHSALPLLLKRLWLSLLSHFIEEGMSCPKKKKRSKYPALIATSIFMSDSLSLNPMPTRKVKIKAK